MTPDLLCITDEYKISTHTSREGSDKCYTRLNTILHKFQPTLPVREVTSMVQGFTNAYHISTHTSREGSDERDMVNINADVTISTHTSREGSDYYTIRIR